VTRSRHHGGLSCGDAVSFSIEGTVLVSATVNPYWTSYRLIANDRVYCGEVAAAIAHDITAMLNAEAISFVWGA
jgi:hypothetical protein